MQILLEIPDSIVEHCKNELKLSDKKTRTLCKRYIESFAFESTYDALSGFEEWMEDNGQEELDEINS